VSVTLLGRPVAFAVTRIISMDGTLSEKAKSRFSIEKEAIEIIGFYSMNHRGILTPRDSSFHMHLRTMDNRISGHLESVQRDQGFMVELPAKER
jgi:acetolactate decarboxylase